MILPRAAQREVTAVLSQVEANCAVVPWPQEYTLLPPPCFPVLSPVLTTWHQAACSPSICLYSQAEGPLKDRQLDEGVGNEGGGKIKTVTSAMLSIFYQLQIKRKPEHYVIARVICAWGLIHARSVVCNATALLSKFKWDWPEYHLINIIWEALSPTSKEHIDACSPSPPTYWLAAAFHIDSD